MRVIKKEWESDCPIISSHEMKLKLQEKGEDNPLVCVRSKIPALDKACENFVDGELYVISGPTKSGKTTFCQTLTHNFTEQHNYSLWFSYEVPPKLFMKGFEDEEPLFFMPEKLMDRSMDWVEYKILESLEKFQTRIVFIDHLHFLFDLVSRGNVSLTIGNVIRRLKHLCNSKGLIIFLLCHTTKGSGDDEISYDNIRDSSFVSQESDCCIMIKRTDNNEGQLRVEFHRRSGCWQTKVPLIKKGKYFYEGIQL